MEAVVGMLCLTTLLVVWRLTPTVRRVDPKEFDQLRQEVKNGSKKLNEIAIRLGFRG